MGPRAGVRACGRAPNRVCAADERQTTTGNEHAVILQEDVMRLQMELNKTMEQYERCWHLRAGRRRL